MFFTDVTSNNSNLNEILESFKVIIETFEDVDDIVGYCAEQGVTEKDKEYVKEKIDEYIEKVNVLTRKSKENFKAAESNALLSLGITLIGLSISVGFPLTGLVGCMIGLISVMIAGVKAGKALIQSSKVTSYILKLGRLKANAKSEKEKEQIQKVINELSKLQKSIRD